MMYPNESIYDMGHEILSPNDGILAITKIIGYLIKTALQAACYSSVIYVFRYPGVTVTINHLWISGEAMKYRQHFYYWCTKTTTREDQHAQHWLNGYCLEYLNKPVAVEATTIRIQYKL